MRSAAPGAPLGHAETAFAAKPVKTMKTVKTVVKTDCKTRDNRENRGMAFKERT